MKIHISLPAYPDVPAIEIESDMPSSWYGDLAKNYFADWFRRRVSEVGIDQVVHRANVRVVGQPRGYTFEVAAVVSSLRFEVTGGH